MPNLRGWEWLIIIALIVVLFGAKRLPDAARGLGRSLRIFKSETKGLTEGEAASTSEVQSGSTPAPLPQQDTSAPSEPETNSQSVPTERSEG
jgi:sec-independent protein translocase protein TatA